MPPKGLKVGFGRGKWFVRKPHLFQVDVKQCMRLSFVFPDMHRLLLPNIKLKQHIVLSPQFMIQPRNIVCFLITCKMLRLAYMLY